MKFSYVFALIAWVPLYFNNSGAVSAALPEPLVTGLVNPESVVVGLGGRTFVSVIAERDKDGDGGLHEIKDGKATPFATGMDDPKGLTAFGQSLFVTDKTRVWKVDNRGKATVFVAADAFPKPPVFLNDIASDEKGMLYVTDSGDRKGAASAIYQITPKGVVTLIADSSKSPLIKSLNGVIVNTHQHLLVLDMLAGELLHVRVTDGAVEKVADGFGRGDGMAWDHFGRLYLSDIAGGKVFVIPRAGDKPILLADGFKSAADICLDSTGKNLLVPDMKAGTVSLLSTKLTGHEISDEPLPVATELAFGDLQWTGWEPDDNGRPNQFRPIVLTHANDKSNRVFVATQQGVIHVFPDDAKAAKTKVFLDMQDKVRYYDKENEEGFLGLAFHPNYAKNGEFYVFYTIKTPQRTNILSRFRVSKDDPNKADPASEQELLRVTHKFWNHDGGTVAFGPDGYLYLALGDGGSANDPDDNGQNLNSWLGKILRIDVNRQENELPYAIPKDNPFIGKKDHKPEIYCSGLRNPWRIAFDRKTGTLWCADVGQNLWEEINILQAGGNYGWNRREGLHPFGPQGAGPSKELTDPIWEYHHDIGKSITGGTVYRGAAVPALAGHYVYADYVSNKLWGLQYDEQAKQVVANRPIASPNLPILSYGEDERGEVYLLTFSATGKGIHRFVEKSTK